MIEVAASYRLILDEGEVLKHCVGTARYCENMSEGKKLIMFIRKNSEPYYTVEFDVEKMKVIQNRGLRNAAENSEVKKFMNKWKVKRLLPLMEMNTKAI